MGISDMYISRSRSISTVACAFLKRGFCDVRESTLERWRRLCLREEKQRSVMLAKQSKLRTRENFVVTTGVKQSLLVS